MTPDLANAELLSQRYGAPVWLFERSGEARAKASQSTVDDVLSMWAKEEGREEAASYQLPATSPEEDASPEAASYQPPAASPEEDASPEAASYQPPAASPEENAGRTADSPQRTARQQTARLKRLPLLLPPLGEVPTKEAEGVTAVAEARGMPESVVERSAQARASAAGVNLDDVLHEWAAEEGLEDPNPEVVPSSQSPSKSPTVAAGTPLPTPTPKAKPIAPAVAGLTGAALLTAVAEARGMPESLVERSAKARAKKTDTTVDDVLNEWAAEEGIAAASPTAEASSSSPSGGGADEGGGGGQNLTGPALLTAVAEARGMPESLVERSAKARAKKTDATVEAVLQEWAEEEGIAAASDQLPAASPTGTALTGPALLTAVAEARGMPESLVERSAKARAKKTDTAVEAVLQEWAEEEGIAAASDQLPAASPTGTALTGPALLTAVAEARGMPESLVERSAKARAKKTDTTVEAVLQEWAEEEGIAAASPRTPDAGPAAAPVAVDAEVAAQDPAADVQEQDTTPEPASRPVKSWRHTLAVGAVAALVPLAILIVLAVFVDVPSDLSDVPWYLIGLEPFVGYLEPFVALVIIPGVVLSSIVIIPIVAWNPAVHPSIRRVALMVLVFLLLTIAALTIIGALQA